MNGQLEATLRDFAEAATAYCHAIKTGDSKKANRHVSSATAAYRWLRKQGEAAQVALLDLLGSEDEAIRYMAAVHVLDFAPEEGSRVLTEIVRGPPSPMRMLAQTSLSQWRSGLIRF